MKVHVLRREQRLQEPPDRVFELFSDPFNLERITPPWLRFRVLTPAPIEPAGSLGELVHRSLVRRDLERIFDFREQAVAQMLSRP